MTVVVFGGAGFIGSHVAEHFSRRGEHVLVVDDRSRGALLHAGEGTLDNWEWVRSIPGVEAITLSILEADLLPELVAGADAVVHAAGQTAVTVSIEDPRTDFLVNAMGTLNVLEAVRKSAPHAAFVFLSTNKVYGGNVNQLPVRRLETRYVLTDGWEAGIPETFSIDLCEHSPYGASKTTADLYVQEYGRLYGLRTTVFRMSCIYGPRQWGVSDQGWVAWFSRAVLEGRPITIYGDGLQTRDLLYVSDLVDAIQLAVDREAAGDVFNIGGGPGFQASLVETISELEALTGREARVSYAGWRPSDQKVYVSDIRKAREALGWEPQTPPSTGIELLVEWARTEIAEGPSVGAPM
jgi:CDP-paratose 2-epimerase